jgi:hypothetical protein
MLIDRKTILDNAVEIHVNTDGQFHVYKQGTRDLIATGESMKQALRNARTEFKKEQIRVAVPFTYLNGGELRPAIARGFHARDSYKILIWVDDGTKEGRNDQIHLYYGTQREVLKPDLSDRDLRLIRKLLERRTKLAELKVQCDGLIQKWQDEHVFDLRAAVTEALTIAAESQANGDEDEEPPPPVSTSTDEAPEDKEVDELLGEA